MCGRYVSARNDHELQLLFDVQESADHGSGPSYNVAPTQPVRIVVEELRAGAAGSGAGADDRVRVLRGARWGLLPPWAKDRRMAARLINARSESVTEKPSFRSAAARRRCVLPADGYYEWESTAGGKVPYYLHPGGDGVLALAGLYELWPDPDLPRGDPDRWVRTCTVLTRPASDSLGHIHDRAPLVLPMDRVAEWLDPSATDPADVRSLIDSLPEPELVPRRVGRAVGSPRNDSPDLVAEVAG